MSVMEGNMAKTEEDLSGTAKIVSCYEFGQEVFFLDGTRILSGKIDGIKGVREGDWMNSIELKVYVTCGVYASTHWVHQLNLFPSREALIEAISNS